MKIRPDYNRIVNCHYCEKTVADKESANVESLYAVTKTHSLPLSVEYICIDVEIPRCKRCASIHSQASILLMPFFLILFFLIGWAYIDSDTGWTDEWHLIIIGIVSDLIISAFLAVLLNKITRMIIMEIFYKGRKDEGNTREYGPIKKLLDCGFTFNKPDPAASAGRTPLDLNVLTNTLSKIQEEDGCLISK